MYSKETEKYIADEFACLRGTCYLDHAAATLYAESQMSSVFKELNGNIFGNPHSLNLSSRHTTDLIDQVRYRILSHFHTEPDEYSVIFTSGATAALKLVVESFDWNGTYSSSHLSSVEQQSFAQNEHKTLASCTTSEKCQCSAKSCLLKAHPNGKSGSFVYLEENHTSVLGMRELAAEKGACVHCMSHDFAFNIFGRKDASTAAVQSDHMTNSLFVYPAQCNFSGVKYPLNWIDKIHTGVLNCVNSECCHSSKWFCFLDTASFVSTNDLDLSVVKPDFMAISFYKIFGYPTGIGALLVRNASAHTLKRKYFGGGTVLISLSSEMYHVPRPSLSDQFEDGTVPFLSIIALRHGFDALKRLTGNMINITLHTLFLARYVHHSLLLMHHSNGAPAVVLYCDTDYEDIYTQGNIVNFNLLRANGEYIGFAEVLHMANLHGIHLRTGCFCNPGACRRHLNLSASDLRNHFQAGHVCGDEMDLINGYPTGSVRISFGYMSTKEDADAFLNMITSCFIDMPIIRKVPLWWSSFQRKYHEKFGLKRLRNDLSCSDDDCEPHARTEVNTKLSEFSDVPIPQYINANRYKDLQTQTESDELALALQTSLSTTQGRNKVPQKAQNCSSLHLRLKHIFLYPVKSCGAMSVDSWTVGCRGLLYDREWMIITQSGVCLTQKQEIKLCLIRPLVDLDEQSLILNFEGFTPVHVPLNQSPDSHHFSKEASLCRSKVCGDAIQGWDCGDDVAEWLSMVLDREGLRLLRQWVSSSRSSKSKPQTLEYQSGESRPMLSLSNEAQFLLVNLASIQWLADELNSNYFDVENLLARFRCNLAVEGSSAFEETKWSNLETPAVRFSVEGPCTRCQMICVDQHTGERTKEPLRTLTASFHGKMRFGIYLRHHLSGNITAKISVNDSISVL